jgi:hypothetical protein
LPQTSRVAHACAGGGKSPLWPLDPTSPRPTRSAIVEAAGAVVGHLRLLAGILQRCGTALAGWRSFLRPPTDLSLQLRRNLTSLSLPCLDGGRVAGRIFPKRISGTSPAGWPFCCPTPKIFSIALPKLLDRIGQPTCVNVRFCEETGENPPRATPFLATTSEHWRRLPSIA